MKIERFEDLDVWKQGVSLATKIYRITSITGFAQDFGLRDQIRRAAVSMSSNIAEGFERNSNNELIRFLKIAKGSAGEVRSQLYIAKELKYITEQDFETIFSEIEKESNQIAAFIRYLEQKKKE